MSQKHLLVTVDVTVCTQSKTKCQVRFSKSYLPRKARRRPPAVSPAAMSVAARNPLFELRLLPPLRRPVERDPFPQQLQRLPINPHRHPLRLVAVPARKIEFSFILRASGFSVSIARSTTLHARAALSSGLEQDLSSGRLHRLGSCLSGRLTATLASHCGLHPKQVILKCLPNREQGSAIFMLLTATGWRSQHTRWVLRQLHHSVLPPAKQRKIRPALDAAPKPTAPAACRALTP